LFENKYCISESIQALKKSLAKKIGEEKNGF
jgi:hypothetical protein